jgi:two-component system chemotaxis sensor kinase CheA
MMDEFAEIREAFALESVEMLAEMESALLILESTPTVGDDFNRLFRAVHTIKGSASIVAADQVENFCHALEHLLVQVRENELPLTKELLTLCLQCHDHIKALIAAFEASDTQLPPRHEQLVSLITQWHPPAVVETTTQPEPEQLLPTDEASTEESAAAQKVVRVDAQKLDQLINLVVELVTASSELESHVKRLGDSASFESASAVSLLVKKIQERAMVFRMVPVGDLFRRFQRLVHDLSASCGKKIQLVTAGAETKLFFYSCRPVLAVAAL